MNQALWILQALLAVLFATSGVMKTSQPLDDLQTKLPWVAEFSGRTVRLLGVVELLAATGLILPGLTDAAPLLAPLSALGLVALMAFAARVHLRRGESSSTALNVSLLAVSAVVAWGRFGPYAH